MAKRTIDGEELMIALESSSGEMQNYLNLDTGEVVLVFDGQVNGETVEDIDGFLSAGDFREIAPINSSQAYRMMDDFVDTLPPGTPRSHLREALSGNRPFRVFKDSLVEYPDIREAWHRYEELCKREYLTEMVAEFGIDADITWRLLPELKAASNRPEEQMLAEFPWPSRRSESQTCRVTLRKSSTSMSIHIDEYHDDILVHEGLILAPADIDPLIDALQEIKANLG